jgi:hypothetical protein
MSAVPESVQRWLDFLTVDPEAQNIQSAVAVSLAKLRENGTVSQQDAKSLMLLAQSLNPRSMPALVTEWMDHVRRDGDRSSSSRNDPVYRGLFTGDSKLAAELCAEAFAVFRLSGGQLPSVLDQFEPATPIKRLVSIRLDSSESFAGPSEHNAVHPLPPEKKAVIWDYVPLRDRLASAHRQVDRDCSMPVPETIEVSPEFAEKIERLEREKRKTGAAKPADVEPE